MSYIEIEFLNKFGFSVGDKVVVKTKEEIEEWIKNNDNRENPEWSPGVSSTMLDYCGVEFEIKYVRIYGGSAYIKWNGWKWLPQWVYKSVDMCQSDYIIDAINVMI